jgi:hypothetical protein
MRLKTKHIAALCLFAFVSLCLTTAYGQGFRRFFLPDNDPPPTELIMARWRFGTNGLIGHMGWSHNYPNSEQHLNQLISEATLIDVKPVSYKLLELSSPEIFKYPVTYVSEPGEMELTEKEVENRRQYIDRGGFIIVDDFDGPVHLRQLRSQLKRAFPDRELIPLTTEHPIFRNFYEIDQLNVVAPYLVGGDPVFFGFPNRNGEIAMVACFNNDLANFWDWIDQRAYPLKPSAEAFRLGINFVMYSMTH